jgi:kinetochore protein Spc7/SPC105
MNPKMDPPSSRPNRPKSRQSIAHVTSSKDIEFDKENATADLGSIRQRKIAVSETDRKKSRSKSLGPGGLEALKESAGNTAKVKGLVAEFE